MIDMPMRVRLSSQPIATLAEFSLRVSPGVSERAANELMLRFLKKRKLASMPATRLKSLLSPDGALDRTMAPMSELLKMSRLTRATV